MTADVRTIRLEQRVADLEATVTTAVDTMEAMSETTELFGGLIGQLTDRVVNLETKLAELETGLLRHFAARGEL